MNNSKISIILPSYNEDTENLELLLAKIHEVMAKTGEPYEIIIVDDGSKIKIKTTSNTRIIRHPYNMGNGAAIKNGARSADGNILVFMDSDGQHDPADIPELIRQLQKGFNMAVGSRKRQSHANFGRWIANLLYNKLASWVVGHEIRDLTSGFRAVHAEKFKQFLHLLPNGFSYPTTITMSFFRAAYPVTYMDIETHRRKGKSHINPVKDGIRFLIIIFKLGTLYSPLKVFLPFSALHFITGICYYGYTYITANRFTNMSALLFISAIMIFLIGLISEQITMLIYQKNNKDR